MPPMVRLPLVGWLTAALVACGAARAAAQPAVDTAPMTEAGPPVSIGGDVTAAAAPDDAPGYFNHTDYDRNALRLVRARVFGEWRFAPRVSLMGELRVEDATDFTAAALYLRWRPHPSGSLFVQVGRIPPVIGAFARRAYGRDNAVIGEPLAYQYLTSLRADALPSTVDDLLRLRGSGWETRYPAGNTTEAPGLPLVAVSRWDTGAEVGWQNERFDLAAAVTQGSPAAPVVRDTNGGWMYSGRAAAHLPAGLTIGVSGATSQWVENAALDVTPAGRDSPSTQSLVGTDVEFGLDRWLVRGEWLRSAFDLPLASPPSSTLHLIAASGFVEGRYRPHPRWQIGVRAGRITFNDVRPSSLGASPIPWDAPVTRVEGTLGFRVNRQLDLRAGWQENWRTGGRVGRQGYPTASVLFWF
jgi:hypothetical protein